MKNKILAGITALALSCMPMNVNAAEIKSVPYRQLQRVEATHKAPSAELENIVRKDNIKLNRVKGVVDKNKFYNKFMKVSDKLGYKNIEDMDMKGFISWNSSVTKFIINAYSGKSRADDVPFEDLISPGRYNGKDSFTGVCRHYSQFIKEVFDITKHLNHNVSELECLVVGNKRDNHAWNMYLMEGKNKIMSTETDVYTCDIHEEKITPAINGTGHPMDGSNWIGMYDKKILDTELQ